MKEEEGERVKMRERVKWVFDLNGVVIVERHIHHPSSQFVPEKLKKKRKITFR